MWLWVIQLKKYKVIITILIGLLIIGAVIIADWPLWTLGVAGMTFIFGLIFFIGQLKIRNKEYNKIYRLDAIDAYNQKLVKKIKKKFLIRRLLI